MKSRRIALAVLLTFLGACDTAVPTGPPQPWEDIPASFSLPATATSNAAATEITPDAYTVILDHFNGSTAGAAHGPLDFASSDIGLGQAGVFAPGNFVEYHLDGSYGSPGTGQGTFEMWVRPNELATEPATTGLLEFNWGRWPYHSYACGGHMMYFEIHSLRDYKASAYVGYPGLTVDRGATSVPIGEWTHLAVSWGPAGTTVYTNGVPVVGQLGIPWLPYWGMYAYLNYWGSTPPEQCNGGVYPFNGLIDEFHFSSVQRTDAEILAHATLAPTAIEVGIDVKPGSGDSPITLKSKGRIPVAVLGTGDFEAGSVDPATVTLGNDDGDDTQVAEQNKGVPMASLADVDGDGDLDLVLHFETQALVGNGDLSAGTTALCLNGNTRDGLTVHGCDGVRVVK